MQLQARARCATAAVHRFRPGYRTLASQRSSYRANCTRKGSVLASASGHLVEIQVDLATERLGSIQGPGHALLNSLLDSTKHIAANKLGVAASDVTLSSVTLASKAPLSIDTASGMTLDSLASDNAHIVVACDAAKDNLHRAVRLLQEYVLELQQGSAVTQDELLQLQQSSAVTQDELLQLQQSSAVTQDELLESRQGRAVLESKVMVLDEKVTHMKESLEPIRSRTILDQARDLLHGGAISLALRGEAWNTRVEDNIETFLQRGAAAGLTVSDLRLTCFGEGSLQQLGAKAAHEAELKDIASTAVAGGPGLERLFLFVYGLEAEAVVSGK
jgi:hypothetical protein